MFINHVAFCIEILSSHTFCVWKGNSNKCICNEIRCKYNFVHTFSEQFFLLWARFMNHTTQFTVLNPAPICAALGWLRWSLWEWYIVPVFLNVDLVVNHPQKFPLPSTLFWNWALSRYFALCIKSGPMYL